MNHKLQPLPILVSLSWYTSISIYKKERKMRVEKKSTNQNILPRCGSRSQHGGSDDDERKKKMPTKSAQIVFLYKYIDI